MKTYSPNGCYSPTEPRTQFAKTALHLASGGGHDVVVATLIAAGATVDAKDDVRSTQRDVCRWVVYDLMLIHSGPHTHVTSR